MTQQETWTSSWQELARLVQLADPGQLGTFLDALDAGERGLAVSRLSEPDRAQLLILLEPAQAATLLEAMPDVQAVDTVEDIPAEQAARIIEELPSAEQADVLGELGASEAAAILAAMAPHEAEEVRTLCSYADDEAGGLMITECLRVSEETTAGEFVNDLQENAERYKGFDVQYAYVIDGADHLVGVLRMRDLLMTRRHVRVADIMVPGPFSVRDRSRLEELRDFFDQHRLFGVPVVDEHARLLGVIRRSAVEEAQAEASEETYRQAQGIIGGEELRTMPLLLRTRRRLGWLSVNILLNLLAASVIAFNRDVVEAVIALAIFLPIISDMSGCSGNQAVAVSIRELTLGVVRPSELRRIWLKELSLGSISGAVLGLLIGLAAWVYGANVWLGLVVGSALAINTLVAVTIGGSVPLLLKRFGQDPALASGPILTTLTDMCGFFLTLSFAAAVLPMLTG